MEPNENWKAEIIKISEKSKLSALLQKLSSNSIAAIRIPNFFTQNELKLVTKNILNQGIIWYPNFEHKQGRIGISATEYYSKLNGKNAYFALVQEQNRIKEILFPQKLNPIDRIISFFAEVGKVSVACEPSFGGVEYFSGLIRAMEQESTLHFDYAHHQLPGWWVSEAETQFSIVAYLKMPVSGGGLKIYKHLWNPKDDFYNKDQKEKGPKGFDTKFLENEYFTTITPSEGDFIIFNSRNFHQVEGIAGGETRLTFNSFLTEKDRNFYLWS